jgi:hypothetical protein
MKNRPIPSHTSTKQHSSKSSGTFSSIKTLITSGFGLIGIGSLLLLTFFVSQNSITQEQDVQSEASIQEGAVSISQTNTPNPSVNNPHTINLAVNTGLAKIEEVTLLFDIITDTTSDVTIENTSPNLVYSIEKDDVDHGFKVLVTAKSTDGLMTNNQLMDLIKIRFTPTKAGPVLIAYDREKSKAIVYGSDPKEDQLTHLSVFSTYIQGDAPPASYPNPEDLSLLNDSLDNYFKFYETTGSRNEVNPRQLVKDRTYTVRHTARIQNVNEDSGLAEDPIIVNQLKINDSESVTRTFRRTNLISQSAPLELQFETTFKAKEVNTLAVVLDSTNIFSEVNEANNSVSVSYTTSSTVKACDQLCSSNAECGDNYTCHDLGSEKRCRLSTNLTSSSCSSNPEKRNLSCNQDCGDNNQCANGMTCFQNRCRSPYSIENTSCINPDNRAQQLIKENCNNTCTDNRGCANNMRCFNNFCRLATNPSSTSCTAATEATVTRTYTSSPTKGGQTVVRPTATPRATATPRPTATASATVTPTPQPTIEPTPVATPVPTIVPESKPNETVLDTFFNRLNALMSSSNWSSSIFTGSLLPVAIIGAGILLLIIAIVIVLRPNRNNKIMSPVSQAATTPVAAKVPLVAHHNPAPPPIPGHGVIMPKRSTIEAGNGTTVSATPIRKPDVIEAPVMPVREIPTPFIAPKPSTVATPPVQAPNPELSKPSQSMIQRLKEKGVSIPETKHESSASSPSSAPLQKTQIPEAGEAPNGDSQPPTPAWPDEATK